jgi:hypothetical protein
MNTETPVNNKNTQNKHLKTVFTPTSSIQVWTSVVKLSLKISVQALAAGEFLALLQ